MCFKWSWKRCGTPHSTSIVILIHFLHQTGIYSSNISQCQVIDCYPIYAIQSVNLPHRSSHLGLPSRKCHRAWLGTNQLRLYLCFMKLESTRWCFVMWMLIFVCFLLGILCSFSGLTHWVWMYIPSLIFINLPLFVVLVVYLSSVGSAIRIMDEWWSLTTYGMRLERYTCKLIAKPIYDVSKLTGMTADSSMV